MDKETLSNYGWIVICVLVMAVMIALSTPFGQFISDAVWSTAQGLFDVNSEAIHTATQAVSPDHINVNTKFRYGSVTSTDGVNENVTTDCISDLITLGGYEYIDVKLLDDNYYLAVYTYDSATGKYAMAPLNNGWVYHGTLRLSDSNYSYMIRVKSDDKSIVTPENVEKAISVSAGRYTYRDSNPRGGREENGHMYFVSDVAYFEHMIDRASGYTQSRNQAVSAPIPLLGYDGIHFEFTNPNYQYAVYAVDSNGTFTMPSGGWINANGKFTATDKTVDYIVRVSNFDKSNLTQAQFDEAVASVKVEHFYEKSSETLGNATGYTRTYSDITTSLTFENKEISGNAIVNNSNTLLATLPNNAQVEVKMNAPTYKFRVFSYDGANYTELTNGYSNYTYRYSGNSSLQYYVQIANQTGGAIATSNGPTAIRCYTYTNDTTTKVSNSKLYGKRIAVIGDSIVQGRYSTNGSSVNAVVEKPWSHLLSEASNTESANFGIGGALVANTDWRSLYTNCENVVGYDVVFICAGTNDYGNNTSETTFNAAFSHVIERLMANNTEVVVCTPVARTNRTNGNSAGLTLANYSRLETQIAESYGLKVIDLFSLTSTSSFTATLADGLHPTQAGHNIIAELVLKNY